MFYFELTRHVLFELARHVLFELARHILLEIARHVLFELAQHALRDVTSLKSAQARTRLPGYFRSERVFRARRIAISRADSARFLRLALHTLALTARARARG